MSKLARSMWLDCVVLSLVLILTPTLTVADTDGPDDYSHCRAHPPQMFRFPSEANATLKLVQIITRHGHRTPINILPHEDTTWACEANERSMYKIKGARMSRLTPISSEQSPFHSAFLQGNCDLGQLTAIGAAAHRALGKNLRRIYVGEHKFVDAVFNKQQVWVRSTRFPRTLASAESLLAGMFPYDDKSEGHSAIDIQSLPVGIEYIHPNRDACPRLNQLLRDMEMTAEWTRMHHESGSVHARVNAILNLSSLPQWNHSVNKVFDIVKSRICAGKRLPCLPGTNRCLTTQLVAELGELHEWELYYEYVEFPAAVNAKTPFSSREISRLNIGWFIEDLHDRMVEKTEESEDAELDEAPKLLIYSAHDTSIISILAALNAVERGFQNPPYSSHLIFELWEAAVPRQSAGAMRRDEPSRTHFVRVLYNGRPVAFPDLIPNELIDPEFKFNYAFHDLASLMIGIIPDVEDCGNMQSRLELRQLLFDQREHLNT